MVFKYALGVEFAAEYERHGEEFKEGTLKRELADELLDMLESEFFAGALYELCQATYKSVVEQLLCDQLKKSMQAKMQKRAS